MPARPTVLHVDDDPTVLELSSDWATDERVTWLTAADPAAGLALLTDRDVDCLISDSMCTADGDPFVVRAADTVPALSVILFTATDREAVDPQTRRAAEAYVEKERPTSSPDCSTASPRSSPIGPTPTTRRPHPRTTSPKTHPRRPGDPRPTTGRRPGSPSVTTIRPPTARTSRRPS
ncbi:hypothetical protein ACFQL0_17740 [Haloplanus litoreus]|uniref:hypothetical protein n=1 Tax=Haloplanus litoreus TaxID=767515 RepID=UPI003606F658